MPKKKRKNITRKIQVVKVDEERQDQVKRPEQYRPTISKIYQDEEGKPLDLTKMQKKKKNRRSLYLKIIVILLVIFAVTLAGFFFFFRDQKFKEGDVALTIDAPKNISSGDEITYTIQYLNQGKAFLGNLELALTYPDGFSYKSSEPETDNTYNQYFKLGNLSSGKGGEVKITGQIIGEVGTTKTLLAKFSYKPSNFNAVFETSSSHATRITSSIIKLDIEGSKQVIPDKEVTIKVKYKNESSEALEKVRIAAVFPDGFTLSSSVPELYEGKDAWQIDRIEAGNEGEIEIKGIFSGQAGDMKELKFNVGLINSQGELEAQVEKSLLVLLINPELSMDLKINGSSEDSSANPGELLTYYLSYKNSSDLEVTDLSISAEIDSEVIDWDTLEDDLNGARSGNTITWTKEEIEGLGSLKPDDEGEILFKLKIKETITLEGSDDKNFQIDNIIKASSAALSDLGGDSLEVESNSITVKVNSVVTLSCESRYYSEENEKLGSGTLPPEVGKTTVYRIFWYIANTTNEADNISVSSSLPEDIYWTGKNKSVSSGTLTFDPATRVITWNPSKVPVGTGQIYSQYVASFEVSTTPVSADIGLYKVLTDKTVLEAADNFTETKLKSNCDSLTSNLTNDTYAQGKGMVVKSQN